MIRSLNISLFFFARANTSALSAGVLSFDFLLMFVLEYTVAISTTRPHEHCKVFFSRFPNNLDNTARFTVTLTATVLSFAGVLT